MLNKSFVLLAISSVSMVVADQYYPYNPSCPGGNCPYQGQGGGPRYHSNDNLPYEGGQHSFRGDGGYYQEQNIQRRDSSDRTFYQEHTQQNAPRNVQVQDGNRGRDGYYNPSSNSSSMNDKNAVKNTKAITDEEIASDVHDILGANWISSGYPDVTFDVKNGVVTLRGNVPTQDEKNKLENSIKKVEGVRQVKSDMNALDKTTSHRGGGKGSLMANVEHKVRQTETDYPRDHAASESDRAINSKIRDRLSGWFTKGYETVILTTENGIVTITGFVETPDEVQKLNKEAKNIEGVKTVNNKVSVQPKK